MIRKTVARAFGRSVGHSARPISDDTDFFQRVRKTFEGLHELFLEQVDRLARLHREEQEARGAMAEDFPWRVSGLQTSEAGTVFTVVAAHAEFHWTLAGPGLIVLRSRCGGREDRHFLSLHPDAEGVFQLVARPDRPGRHEFRYTSLGGIVAWVLGRS